MKKYLSVFYLFTKESFLRIIILWMLSFTLQGILLRLSASSFPLSENSVASLRDIGDKVYLPLIFIITVAITAILLLRAKKQSVSKYSYTLRRLLIKEKTVFLIRAFYNTLIIFMLFALSVVFYFLIFGKLTEVFPENYFSSQAAYMTMYNYPFLHNVFAGRDILRLTRNLLFITAIGVNLAADSFLGTRGKTWFGAHISVISSYFLFTEGQYMGSIPFDVFFLSEAIGLIVCTLTYVLRKEEQYD